MRYHTKPQHIVVTDRQGPPDMVVKWYRIPDLLAEPSHVSQPRTPSTSMRHINASADRSVSGSGFSSSAPSDAELDALASWLGLGSVDHDAP